MPAKEKSAKPRDKSKQTADESSQNIDSQQNIEPKQHLVSFFSDPLDEEVALPLDQAVDELVEPDDALLIQQDDDIEDVLTLPAHELTSRAFAALVVGQKVYRVLRTSRLPSA